MSFPVPYTWLYLYWIKRYFTIYRPVIIQQFDIIPRLYINSCKIVTISENLRLQLTQPPADETLVMYQKWRNLLFIHWEYPAGAIQQTLPPGLQVDTFRDKAYVGIVPFRMKGIRPRFLPAVPYLSDTLELNLRTYAIDQEGIPGVWFYALDAKKWLAVKIARRFFHLNYQWARQQLTAKSHLMTFKSQRIKKKQSPQNQYLFQPEGEIFQAVPGTLDFFLTARYILFSYDQKKKQLYQGRIYHDLYPLQAASLIQHNKHLFKEERLKPPLHQPDHIIYSPGTDVKIYRLKKLLK